jgi:hypothetical protein
MGFTPTKGSEQNSGLFSLDLFSPVSRRQHPLQWRKRQRRNVCVQKRLVRGITVRLRRAEAGLDTPDLTYPLVFQESDQFQGNGVKAAHPLKA